MDHLQIANTILEQLGGRMFRMMTGAKHFLAHKEGAGTEAPMVGGLSFKLTMGNWNHVKIELTHMDDYTVVFNKIRGFAVVEQKVVRGVYCDNLREVFEKETGLYTRL